MGMEPFTLRGHFLSLTQVVCDWKLSSSVGGSWEQVGHLSPYGSAEAIARTGTFEREE